MIPDTNQINQAIADAAIVKTQVQMNWPAICFIAVWLRADLRNIADYVVLHGGIGWLIWKLLWNPPQKLETAVLRTAAPLSAIAPESKKENS